MTGAAGQRRVLITILEAVGDRYPVEVSLVEPTGTIIETRQGGFAPSALPASPPIAVANPRATAIALQKVGLALFTLLHEAGLKYFGSPDEPAVMILDIRPQELRVFPWELMWNPESAHPFADREFPAVRGRLPFRPQRDGIGVPIRVLVIVGDPEDDAELRQDEEIEAIHAGLREAPCCWHVDVVRGPDQRALLEEYPDLAPDIVHVIGHGMPTAGGPSVRITPPGGRAWPFSAGYLADAMPRRLMPRLAVLNACRTSAEPHVSVELAHGLVATFLSRGSAAVVAMQGDVGSAPAVRFTESLYRRLAKREPLDVAMAGARVELRNTTEFTPRDWALPVLELRADPASVLHQPRRADPHTVIKQHHGFRQVSHLIDRAPQRRKVHQRAGEANGLLFVTGHGGVGKSLLVRSWVVSQVVGGAAVIYHSLERGKRSSSLDFLLGLVDMAGRWLGDRAQPLCQDTAAALCRTFRQTEPGWPGTPTDAPTEPARSGLQPPLVYTPPRPGAVPVPVDEAYSIVRDLLVTLAGAERLVLVLDHVRWVDEQGAFVRGLLEPASRDELRNVQIMVVEASLTGIAGDSTDIPITPDRHIPVPAFARADAVALTREYLARFRPTDIDENKWQKVRDYMIDWATKEMADTQVHQLHPVEIPETLRLRMIREGLLSGSDDW